MPTGAESAPWYRWKPRPSPQATSRLSPRRSCRVAWTGGDGEPVAPGGAPTSAPPGPRESCVAPAGWASACSLPSAAWVTLNLPRRTFGRPFSLIDIKAVVRAFTVVARRDCRLIGHRSAPRGTTNMPPAARWRESGSRTCTKPTLRLATARSRPPTAQHMHTLHFGASIEVRFPPSIPAPFAGEERAQAEAVSCLAITFPRHPRSDLGQGRKRSEGEEAIRTSPARVLPLDLSRQAARKGARHARGITPLEPCNPVSIRTDRQPGANPTDLFIRDGSRRDPERGERHLPRGTHTLPPYPRFMTQRASLQFLLPAQTHDEAPGRNLHELHAGNCRSLFRGSVHVIPSAV